jgi:hypothetical protein
VFNFSIGSRPSRRLGHNGPLFTPRDHGTVLFLRNGLWSDYLTILYFFALFLRGAGAGQQRAVLSWPPDCAQKSTRPGCVSLQGNGPNVERDLRCIDNGGHLNGP